MEVFFMDHINSFTGSIMKDNGYFIREINGRFYAQCKPGKHQDIDHWQFLVQCAQMAIHAEFLRGISVTIDEAAQAIYDWQCPGLRFDKLNLLTKRAARLQLQRMAGRRSDLPDIPFNAREIVNLHLFYLRNGYYAED